MEENINKGTMSPIHMWAPIVKAKDGKLIAVLSDDSVDRDDEVVGKEALLKMEEDDGFVVALIDHENKALNQVAEWINRRVEQITDKDGNKHNAFVAEPRFFKSNPKAVIIQNMLEKDGAKMGISIGAMVKDSEERKIYGKKRKVYTDLELLEASFVAIPSNRHGQAMLAMAKSYGAKLENKDADKDNTLEDKISAVNKRLSILENNYNKNKEVGKMAEDKTNKKPDEEDDQGSESEDSGEDKDASTTSDMEKTMTDLNKKVEDQKEALDKSNAKIEGLAKQVETLSKLPLDKSITAGEDQSTDGDATTDKDTQVDVKKEREAGKLPVY